MRLFKEIALSLLFHLLIILGALFLPNSLLSPKKEIVTIEIQPVSHNKTQQIVRQTLVPESEKTDHTDDPLRFLAERTERVKQQLRAQQSGLTKNRGSQAKPSSSEARKAPSGLKDFLPGLKPTRQPAQAEVTAEEPGISTFGNDLPDHIKVGQMTALNTDRYLYYSYYSRAEELIRPEWEPRIQSLLERPSAELRDSANRKFTTVVEVWFFGSGELHSVHVLKPSGVPQFDQVAIDSFHIAKMIPHPPPEKIEKDGLARFKWGFTVEYTPKVLVRQ